MRAWAGWVAALVAVGALTAVSAATLLSETPDPVLVPVRLPAHPEPGRVLEALELVEPLETQVMQMGDGVYRCRYWDDSGSGDINAPFLASIMWCEPAGPNG